MATLFRHFVAAVFVFGRAGVEISFHSNSLGSFVNRFACLAAKLFASSSPPAKNKSHVVTGGHDCYGPLKD